MQGALNSQNNAGKEKQIWRTHTSQFQHLLQSYSHQGSNNRHTDQWNGIKNPEINPYIYSQLIIDKSVKTIQRGKNSLFNEWC